MGLLYADILVSRQNQPMWAGAKYLILIPERITLSPRAYMQFHNHDRQLISLCEIQKCHAARESA